MTQENRLNPFDELSEKYAIWVLKYCSPTFGTPLFLIWYNDTDENCTSRLLTWKNGKIFAINSLSKLKSTLLASLDELFIPENLLTWLDHFNPLEVKDDPAYDLILVMNEIEKNNLDILTIEGFANFFNLFDDFIHQDERNNRFQSYLDNEPIKKTWNYYYEYIFWPKFNDRKKFETWNRPQLDIDSKDLLSKLKDMIESFDSNIQEVENTISR